MAHGATVTVERKNKGGFGRVGSGRVQVGSGRGGWTLFFTRLDSSLNFFRSAVTIAPLIGLFVLPAEGFEQAMLSLDKLSQKSCDAEYNWMLQIFSSSL